MAVNFKLVPEYTVIPEDDDMSRTWTGWCSTATVQENFERNRGLWLLGPRADRERYATFSLDGVICMVAAIDGVETIAAKHPGVRPKRAIAGQVLTAGHPVYEALIGRSVDTHRNPVTYIDDPADGPRTCACGCGAPVPGHRIFLPGHDQRAVHDRIARRWGSTFNFINWFDATYPNASDSEDRGE